MDKRRLREFCLNIRNELKKDEKIKIDRIISHKILMLDEYKKASTVAIYSPFRSEINLNIVEEDAIQNSKKLAYPRIISSGVMNFYTLTSGNKMLKNKLGIYEPLDIKENMVMPENIDVIIVPMLAFDKDLNRLGYGGGYYDRYLSHNKIKAYKVGICIKKCEFQTIYASDNDVKMDIIIDETTNT